MRRLPLHTLLLGLALFGLTACEDDPACESCAEPDAGVLDPDLGPVDSGPLDAAMDQGVCPLSECPPETCEEAYEAGACAAHRACSETPDGPRCEYWCEEGYVATSLSAPCRPCRDGVCTSQDDCSPGGVVPAYCASIQRECVDRDNGPACGECTDGFALDANGDCVAGTACGGMACAEGEFPRPDDVGGCACEPGPCDPGSAYFETSADNGACLPCGFDDCASNPGGLSQYGWTDDEGSCVCLLEPGWSWPTQNAATTPIRCDEDGDGWMASSAWDAWSRDDAVGEVTRLACRPNFVDRVELRNEYGQSRLVYLCESELGEVTIEREPCANILVNPSLRRHALPLVESDRNDRRSQWTAALNDPNSTLELYGYGEGENVGRAPEPAELNTLTRGCVQGADYNANGILDVEEAQGEESSTVVMEGWELWSEFAHFMELHTTQYVPATDPLTAGRMVIAEVSRCDPTFPLDYASVGSASETSYWRECHRQPDARYDVSPQAPPPVGFDFAQWSCDTPGSCTMAPFPYQLNTDPVGIWQVDHGAVIPGEYGLCGHRGAQSLDWGSGGGPAWRGMHHHSQFKCVSVEQTPGASTWERAREDFNPDVAPDEMSIGFEPGYLDFQQCALAEAEAGSSSPRFECSAPAEIPSTSTVGWAAIRYSSPATLSLGLNEARVRDVAGCVDEAEWTGLCEPLPGATTLPPTADIYHGDSTDFGALLACGPVIYTWAESVGPDVPPDRTLLWDEGRWE